MANIAILSTAHIHTRSFLENLSKATDGRRAHVIWDDEAERGQRFAVSCGAKFVADLEAVLRDPAADGFLICAENTRHWPLLQKVLPAGKPVFCEKPLVTTVTELRALARLREKFPSPLFCGYFLPHLGDMRTVAQSLKKQAFGTVTRVRFRNAHHAAYGRWFDPPDVRWFTDPKRAGGGAFLDMGTHAVHLLRTLFGKVTELWATIHNESGIYPAVDDSGIAHLRFASGVLGTVEASWTQTGGLGGLEVVGSEKSLWHNGAEYVIGQPDQKPAALVSLPDRPTRVDRLIAAIRGELTSEELETDLAATMDAVAIVEAAYESSRTGSWVKVAAVAG